MFRWALPGLMLAVLASSTVLGVVGGSSYRAAVVAQVLFYGAGVLVPAARIPRFFLSASVAASVAWWKFLCGERFVVWDPTPRPHAATR